MFQDSFEGWFKLGDRFDELTRILFEKRALRREHRYFNPLAFLPGPNPETGELELSVFGIADISEREINEIGQKMANLKKRSVRGHASFIKTVLPKFELTLDPDNEPIEGHANIRNWPVEPYQQLLIVDKLADQANTSINLFNPTISPD